MTEIRLPQLTMAMESATLVEWLVAEGDHVSQGQVVASVETEKAVEEIEASADGIIRLLAAAGDEVPVDGVMARIREKAQDEAEVAIVREPPSILSPPPKRTASGDPPDAVIAHTAPAGYKAAPAAKALALNHDIDLATVVGSGPGGRIVLRDVEQIMATSGDEGAAAAAESNPRRALVANLVASWTQIPHINIMGELDAAGLVGGLARARQRANGTRTTMTDLLLIAVTGALKANPTVNALNNRPSAAINLALAVSIPGGVVAPVVRDISSLELDNLSQERHRLVTAARTDTLSPADVAGATCTVSNLGTYPVDLFTPVITGPQSALVTFGRIRRVPVIEGDAVMAGDRIWVDVALDHRTADGAVGGAFLKSLASIIQELPDLVVASTGGRS